MFNRKSYLLIFLMLTMQQVSAQSENTNLDLSHQVDSIIASAIEQHAFPGCVIYAQHGDSTVFFKSYGYHTYDSVRKVQDDDLYDLASITKVVGATLALMKLYEEGLLDLDAPIRTYVDRIGCRVGNVTIREALAHHGGLRPWIPYHQEIRRRNQTFRKKDISQVKDQRHVFAINDSLYLHNRFYKRRIKKLIRKSKVAKQKGYRYSGLFFYLVPEIVQKLSGQPLEHYLDSQFYRPLGAKTLGFLPGETFELSRIAPTEVDTFFRMETIHGQVHDEGAILMEGISGNAGLFSNAADLARVFAMLRDMGSMDSLQLLEPSTVALFTTTQYPGAGNRRALGFDKPLLEYDAIRSSVARSASFRSFGHTGYTGTLAWADPEADLIFIFLSNRVYPSRKNTTLYDLNVRPTIHQLIYDHIRKKPSENSDLSKMPNKQ